MSERRRANDEGRSVDQTHVRSVRLGHGANCSSLGSVVDTLFATATVSAAVFAAVVAALAKEPVKTIPGKREHAGSKPGGEAR